VGGYTTDGFGVGMELVVKLHQDLLEKEAPYVIKFIPDPVCWVHPPKKMKDLYRQRKTWQTETINSLTSHKKMLFNPKYKRIGMLAMPYYWLFEVIGPFLDIIGYITIPLSFALGIVSLNFMVSFLVIALLYGIVLSVGSLILEEDMVQKYPARGHFSTLSFYALLENIGYQQYTSLMRIAATFTYKRNKRTLGK